MAKIIKKDNDQKTIIQIQTPKSGVRILLNDDMIILNKPVEYVGYFVENPTMLLKTASLNCTGFTAENIIDEGILTPSTQTLARTALERGDRNFMYPMKLL